METPRYSSRTEYAWNETAPPIKHMLNQKDMTGKAIGVGMAFVSPITFTTAYIDSFIGLDKTGRGYIERD